MKKHEVKPFINTVIKDNIYRISDVTGYSVISICEDLCTHAIKSDLAKELSSYFKRSFVIDGMTFNANGSIKKFEPLSTDNERITMTLNREVYDYFYDLSYAIGCSVAKVVAYAVEKSMNDFDFLNRYIEQFLNKKVSKEVKGELLKIVKTVNKGNVDEEYNLVSLLLYIADEYRRFDEGVKGVLKDAYLQEGV